MSSNCLLWEDRTAEGKYGTWSCNLHDQIHKCLPIHPASPFSKMHMVTVSLGITHNAVKVSLIFINMIEET